MERIYFFNAANFSYAEIDLRKKNIFFVGDNGSGKTTAIRAIHYYYNSDVKALGIDANKKGFKEFYFPYDNSFIVYDFGGYFVLMYKRHGEIKRVFSRQGFDVNRVLKGDEAASLKEVIEYAKSSKSFIPKTQEEYKKTVYGLNGRYLDFKVATVKNYHTFINLYNKIFNVNRAVFDTKSIKETIFTTLERVEAGEINYQEFANELMDYRNYFQFYRAFKRKEGDIERLYLLKNGLLRLRDELEELLGKIAYKKEIEEGLVDKIREEIEELERRKRGFLKQFGLFKKRIECIKKEIEKKIFEVRALLEETDRLKRRFNLKALQEAKSRVVLKEELSERLIKLKTSLNELVSGIKGEAEVIEEEIRALKREKRILKDKIREKEIRLKREVEEEFEERVYKLKEEKEIKEENILESIKSLQREIEAVEEEKSGYVKELKIKKEEFEARREEIRAKIKDEIKALKNRKREVELQKEEMLDEVVKLKRELNRLKNSFEEEREKISGFYQKELNSVDEKIRFYKTILYTKPGSFKEFLNQNVENWEEELYPVMDERLLDMGVDELNPKVVSERVFGIELNRERLKSIPTMKEAEEAVNRLSLAKKSLSDELNKRLALLKKDFEAKEIKILSESDVAKERSEALKKEAEFLGEEIIKLKKSLKEKLFRVDELEREEIKLINVNIRKKEALIKSIRNEINGLKRELKRVQKEFLNRLSELNREKTEIFKKIRANLESELVEKEKAFDKRIRELESKKANISKDERIREIEKEISGIEKRLKEIQRYELVLREYEGKRGLIEKEGEYKEAFKKYKGYKERFEDFSDALLKRVNQKVSFVEREIGDKEREFERVKEGLRKLNRVKLKEHKVKTNEYLSILIDEYLRKEGEFKDKRISLKDAASAVGAALMKFRVEGLEVGFNLELLSELDEGEVEKVDEVYLFKSKKFEVLNKTRLKGLKNLISGILDKKLDSFEGAKEEFLEQVKKINKNLNRVDFGIIKKIRIEIEENRRSILKIFDEIKRNIEDLVGLLESEESLFFERAESERRVKKIEELFELIRKEVKDERFTLIDVVDINVKFVENEKENSLKLIKNESSTGGSILLKIAIAVSLLELFIKEKANLFLILDEVSVLSAKNQKLLKEYVNERGLGVIYVTPDLPLVDVEGIDIYKFRNVGGEFEVVRLIGKEGVRV